MDKVNQYISIINDLLNAEKNPIRSDYWLVPLLHEKKRRQLWKEMTDVERETTESKLTKKGTCHDKAANMNLKER